MNPLAQQLGISKQPYGRPRVERDPEFLRVLTAEELDLPRGHVVPHVKRLSQRHHMVARLIAQGVPVGETAIIAGYTPQRVTMLKADRAFRQLVEFYKGKVDEVYIDRHKALAGLSADAIIELHERLEEEPGQFSTNQLLDIIKTAGDRSGLGPSVTVNVGIADRLNAARRRIEG